MSTNESVRLDRWLWAARFFRTRSQAKDAIEGGKVRVDGARAKPSRDIVLGMRLTIPRGYDAMEVIVIAVSDRRGQGRDAALLYRETNESLQRRDRAVEERRLTRSAYIAPPGRPNKRDRRAIGRLKLQNEGESF